MSIRLTASLFASLSLVAAAQVQENPPVAPPTPAPKLTETQVATIMKQLTELETQIHQMRGSTLSSVLQKLRTAVSSDQAAMSLYLECETLVSLRKEVDKAEARRREEAMQKNLERKGSGGNAKDQGDFASAVRLQLQYLILTLEAHESSDEDLPKMVTKVQGYLQEVVAAAPKLKGQALNYLRAPLGGGGRGNPIIEAFQLDRYLNRKGWSNRPLDFGDIYIQTIFPAAEEANKEALPGLYDARISAEAAFRQESMFEPEFVLWKQNELPALYWQRAVYLFEKGPTPINAMADMLKLIKEYPSHADAPNWLKDLRKRVEAAKPLPVGVNPERPAGT